MENFLEKCYCWIRQKDISQNKISKEEQMLDMKLQNQLSCGGCFACIDKITDFAKIAKIGTNQFGFCSEECYHEWLLNPVAQFLAPINVNLLKSYLRDNPQ
uniref:Uncharacterized protein n=1 Tax=viral metagenome TaxID=1070528 RepID=A0A6C0ENJ7_9ZZZZ